MKRLLSLLALGIFMLLPTSLRAEEGKVKLPAIPHYTRINIDFDRLVVIKGPIRAEMADEIVKQVFELTHPEDGTVDRRPIYYIINTNGGSLMAGLQIERAMESSDTKSICIVDRAAFSMGAILLAHCNVAYIHKDASVMFHEGFVGMEGKMSEIISFMTFLTNDFNALTKHLADKLHLSVEVYAERQKNEWWMNAEQAVIAGLCRGVVEKLEYPEPEKEESPLSLLFGGSKELRWTPADGIFDLTWYPVGTNPHTDKLQVQNGNR